MALVNTHVGYVESWECDTNAHLNVRYYAKRYDEALDMLCALAGREPVRVKSRHSRFHKELRFDDLTRVMSARVVGGPVDNLLVHRLENAETGEVAATALDIVDAAPDVPTVTMEEVAEAMPRSVPLEPGEVVDAASMLAAGQATISNIRVADPASFDASGRYRAYEFVSGFSDGGAPVWSFVGLTKAYLSQNKLGRIAVETNFAILAEVRPGAVLRQVSFVPEVAAKSMLLVHQVDDARTGEVVATSRGRVMILDFATRRSAPIPDFVRAAA